MDIPADVQIRSTIQTGSVYYFPEDNFNSPEPHYFIVLNTEPSHDEVIFLVCASTRIEAVRGRSLNCPKETLVEVSPKQYVGFPRYSIVNCNKVIPKSINQLVGKLSQGKLKPKPKMGLHLVDKLIRGVLYSDQVDRRIKRQLCTDYCG